MTNHESPPQLLTITEAAGLLQLQPGTVYKWHRTGVNQELFIDLRTVPGARPRVRVDPDRLREYMNGNRRTVKLATSR